MALSHVETDLSDQKNGTSAENGGTCAPYPIIREPELCLPYCMIEIMVDLDTFEEHM